MSHRNVTNSNDVSGRIPHGKNLKLTTCEIINEKNCNLLIFEAYKYCF